MNWNLNIRIHTFCWHYAKKKCQTHVNQPKQTEADIWCWWLSVQTMSWMGSLSVLQLGKTAVLHYCKNIDIWYLKTTALPHTCLSTSHFCTVLSNWHSPSLTTETQQLIKPRWQQQFKINKKEAEVKINIICPYWIDWSASACSTDWGLWCCSLYTLILEDTLQRTGVWREMHRLQRFCKRRNSQPLPRHTCVVNMKLLPATLVTHNTAVFVPNSVIPFLRSQCIIIFWPVVASSFCWFFITLVHATRWGWKQDECYIHLQNEKPFITLDIQTQLTATIRTASGKEDSHLQLFGGEYWAHLPGWVPWHFPCLEHIRN